MLTIHVQLLRAELKTAEADGAAARMRAEQTLDSLRSVEAHRDRLLNQLGARQKKSYAISQLAFLKKQVGLKATEMLPHREVRAANGLESQKKHHALSVRHIAAVSNKRGAELLVAGLKKANGIEGLKAIAQTKAFQPIIKAQANLL